MIYSKFLNHSVCFASLKGLTRNYSVCKINRYLLNSSLKVLSTVTPIQSSQCQYSTIFKSQKYLRVDSQKDFLPLSLTAFISTVGSKDAYQIVITNPAEGTTDTLNSSLDSINKIKSADVTPEIADAATTLSDELASAAAIIEPPLSSLDLAHNTPVGVIQMFLEYLHVSHHCPWWVAIVACTVIARILLIPLLIKIQKNAINMSNYMPQLQYLQAKFGEARRTGNSMEANRYANEMMMYMKDNKISPMRNAMLPLLQAPVFLSFFFALRAMAKAPVESMKEGGIWWVSDLTIPDPYYVLPLVACSTLYVILRVGAESGIRLDNMKLAKYFITALPVIALPFTINFPSAILYYWVTNNFMTLIIVSILKIKPVRLYFNLPVQKPVDPRFKAPKTGFIKGVKDAFEDQKVLAAVEDRRRMDSIRFQKAGTGPIPRTYSYDPTKPRPSNVASVAKTVAAKERKT